MTITDMSHMNCDLLHTKHMKQTKNSLCNCKLNGYSLSINICKYSIILDYTGVLICMYNIRQHHTHCSDPKVNIKVVLYKTMLYYIELKFLTPLCSVMYMLEIIK